MPVWTTGDCCSCGDKDVEVTVMYGVDPDTGYPVIGYVCHKCFVSIMKMREERADGASDK